MAGGVGDPHISFLHSYFGDKNSHTFLLKSKKYLEGGCVERGGTWGGRGMKRERGKDPFCHSWRVNGLKKDGCAPHKGRVARQNPAS